jgi:O-acetyl-ADP-ribose deacetylase (regulator of RNase III)
MIREVQGDILLSKAEAIAHGIGVDDDFKQGLALSLREQWPSMYKDFRHYCHTYSPKEGDLWTWKGPGSAAIVNLFTQSPPKRAGEHPGKATLSSVGRSLKHLAQEVSEKGYKSVALTKVATGVGGLNWEEVKPLVEQYLGELKVPVYVYTTYVKGRAAEA